MAETLTKRKKKLLLFVNAYLEELNGTKAAIAAGYSEKTAAQAGSRLLKTVECKAMISQRMKGVMANVELAAESTIQRMGVTQQNIIAALADMGLAHKTLAKFLKVNNGNLDYDFTGATEDELSAIAPMIAEIKTEHYAEGKGENKREVIRSTVKIVERKGILELLGKWNKLKMWAADRDAGGVFANDLSLDELEEYARTGALPERVRERVKGAECSKTVM